jgi:hypothetical protein
MADHAMATGAVFDSTRLYRYELTRRWTDGPTVAFVMLNPSTADDQTDDATIRRCIGYARRWGYGTLRVVNLFALRATDPARLRLAEDPVGPDNDAHVLAVATEADRVVAAWGAHGCYLQRDRRVLAMLGTIGDVFCLGMTKAGQPKHPLRLSASLKPEPYQPNRSL